jgi:hypothetical protein
MIAEEYDCSTVPIGPKTQDVLNQHAARGWSLVGSHVVTAIKPGTALSAKGPEPELRLFCIWRREKS